MEAYWWFIYLGVAIILSLLFQFARGIRETVIFLGTALAGVAAIIQLQSQSFQTQQNVRHNKVTVSFSYIEKWNSPPLSDKLRTAARAIDSVSGKSPQEIEAFLADHDTARDALIKVFNLFEDIGLAIRTGYADNETLCQYFSEPALRYFSRLRPWLDNYRSIT